MDLTGWTITHHAEKRRRQMEVSTDEVARAVASPQMEYPGARGHPPGRRVRVRDALAVVVDPRTRTVVSILWNRAEGRNDDGTPVLPSDA